MKQSSTGFTGNSEGSLGGASPEDLKQGFIAVKDEDDDNELIYGIYRTKYGPFWENNPEPDLSIDRDSDSKTNWE